MPALVVSVHDVSPLTWQTCDAMLRELSDLGIEKTSLLVIPNHHHRAPIREHPQFCTWLSQLVHLGHEPVLHGYYHLRERPPAQTLRRRVITEVYTAGEGEFYDLSTSDATGRLRAGLADLAFLPHSFAGFIAPAWLLGADAATAVDLVGFRYTTSIHAVRDRSSGRSFDSRSLVWSTRSGLRRMTSLVWNECLATQVSLRPLVRIGLHPADFRFPSIWNQSKRLARCLLEGRKVATYQEIVENPSLLDG